MEGQNKAYCFGTYFAIRMVLISLILGPYRIFCINWHCGYEIFG